MYRSIIIAAVTALLCAHASAKTFLEIRDPVAAKIGCQSILNPALGETAVWGLREMRAIDLRVREMVRAVDMPKVEAAMGQTLADFYAEMEITADRVLNVARPLSAASVRTEIAMLWRPVGIAARDPEIVRAVAGLVPELPLNMGGKAGMETRGFGDTWPELNAQSQQAERDLEAARRLIEEARLARAREAAAAAGTQSPLDTDYGTPWAPHTRTQER